MRILNDVREFRAAIPTESETAALTKSFWCTSRIGETG